MEHRRDIEGLRALAVLAVIAYHAGVPGTDGGFVGVDVFFVISGFLITGLLISERERSGRIALGRFYARRIRRLLPISTVVLAVTAAVGVAVLPAPSLEALGTDIAAAAGFAANLVFAARGTDYLAGDTDPSALQHYWSLAVEEQFYLVWPGLIAAVTIGATRVRRRLVPLLLVILVGSFALSVVLTERTPTWAYFGLHTRAFELATGAVLAVAWHRVERLPGRAALGWIGLGGVVASVAWMGRVATFPGWVAAVPVLATAAMIACGDDTAGGPRRLLANWPMQWIGGRSYSLYLWHWPVLVLLPHQLGRPLGIAETLLAMLITVVLAETGFRLIENPVRYSRRLATRQPATYAIAIALIGVSLSAGMLTRSYRPEIRTGVVAAAPIAETTTTALPAPPTAAPDDLPAAAPVDATATTTTTAVTTTTTTSVPLIDNRDDRPLEAVVSALEVAVLPDNVRPSVYEASADTNVLYTNGCHQYLTAAVAEGCVFGDLDSTLTVGLIGDSHAAQWFSALEAIATNRGWRLVVHTQGGCPVLDVLVWNNGAATELPQCRDWITGALDDFVQEGVSVAITSQYWGLLAADSRSAISAETWERELPVWFDRLRDVGIEPLLMLDTPDPAESAPSCASSHASDLRPCEPGPLRNTERGVRVNAVEAAEAAGVGFVDPHAWLCSADGDTPRCPVVVGDILVYRDSHHLSDTFVRWLTPVLDAEIGPWIDARR